MTGNFGISAWDWDAHVEYDSGKRYDSYAQAEAAAAKGMTRANEVARQRGFNWTMHRLKPVLVSRAVKSWPNWKTHKPRAYRKKRR